jgi:hypothetical protein
MWPGYTPRHRVPILVAFYDMHGLQWDYSFPRSPHGELKDYIHLKYIETKVTKIHTDDGNKRMFSEILRSAGVFVALLGSHKKRLSANYLNVLSNHH